MIDSACVAEVGGGSNILNIGSSEQQTLLYDDHITIVGQEAFYEKNTFYIIVLVSCWNLMWNV